MRTSVGLRRRNQWNNELYQELKLDLGVLIALKNDLALALHRSERAAHRRQYRVFTSSLIRSDEGLTLERSAKLFFRALSISTLTFSWYNPLLDEYLLTTWLYLIEPDPTFFLPDLVARSQWSYWWPTLLLFASGIHPAIVQTCNCQDRKSYRHTIVQTENRADRQTHQTLAPRSFFFWIDSWQEYELRERNPVATPNDLISSFSAGGYFYLEPRTLQVLFCPCVLNDRYFVAKKQRNRNNWTGPAIRILHYLTLK